MRKIVVIIFMSIITICANAQNVEQEVVKTYIEIYSMHKASVPTIDTGEGKGTNTYRTEEGDVIEFHSSIGAVNWFVGNGWKLESVHMSTCNDRTVKMYVVSKETTLEQAKSRQLTSIKK